MIALSTKSNTKKYGIRYSCGIYDTRIEGILCVCDTREEASSICDKLEQRRNHIREIALKEDEYGCNPYLKLHDEFDDVYFSKIGHDENLTEEEWDDFYEYATEENFKKFLIDKGYTEEVANATMVFNNGDDWSETEMYYTVVEILYMKPDEDFKINGDLERWMTR